MLNTAIAADDSGNRPLRQWRGELTQMVKGGIARKEIKRSVEPQEVADVIICSLEGALMISRLEGEEALLVIQSYLDFYF